MPSPQTWLSEKHVEGLGLSDLSLSDDGEALSLESTSGNDPTSSLSLETDLAIRLNAIPPEVLSEIFWWCTPTVDDQESVPPRSALTISHVCRHWRAVSVSSPYLWTYTKIPVYQGVLKPALALMELYLERARSRPIFVDLDFVDAYSYYKPVLDLFEKVVSKAREHRPAFALADSFLATHLEASSTDEGPTREEWYFWNGRPAATSPSPLHNNITSYMQLANTPAPARDVSPAVTLRALRIAVGSFILEPYLHWSSSLTFLVLKDKNDYTNLTVFEAARILAAFPLLVHCGMHIDFDMSDPPRLERGIVNLAFLQSLSLSWTDWIDIGPLLDSISAPSVRELELAGRLPDTATGDNWGHLESFLRRNSPPLSHLILDQIDCFHISFLNVQALVPTLEGLWLEDCLLHDTIIRGLVPALGPRGLKTLVLLECYAFNIEVLARTMKEAHGTDTRDDRGTEDEKVKVYVDGCEVTPANVEIIRQMGLDNLEIGPSSMPVDLKDDESSVSSVEVIE